MSISTPNTQTLSLNITVNIQIDINSYTFDNKFQYWIELNRVKLFYKMENQYEKFIKPGYLIALHHAFVFRIMYFRCK